MYRQEGQDLFALDPNGRDPNGQVTIDEYSPDFMSGSFSGQLVEKYERSENSDGYRRIPRGQALTVVRNISGRFWVPTPWFGDDRYEVEPVETLGEDLAADIIQWMPGAMTPGMPDLLKGARGAPTSPTSPTSPAAPAPAPASTGASAVQQCDCSCTAYAKVEDLTRQSQQPGFTPTPEDEAVIMCLMQCMMQYAACAR